MRQIWYILKPKWIQSPKREREKKSKYMNMWTFWKPSKYFHRWKCWYISVSLLWPDQHWRNLLPHSVKWKTINKLYDLIDGRLNETVTRFIIALKSIDAFQNKCLSTWRCVACAHPYILDTQSRSHGWQWSRCHTMEYATVDAAFCGTCCSAHIWFDRNTKRSHKHTHTHVAVW